MHRLILIVLPVIFCFACSTSQTVKKMPALPTAIPKEYKIGVADILNVVVWKSPELSMEGPVRPDGRISVPLVGDLVAAGKGAEELAADVVTKLSAFVHNPVVTVMVTDPVSADYANRVRVTGAVGSPQSLQYREGMTVLDLVLLAGGPTQFAKGNSAKLYRTIDDKVEVFPVNLSDILKDGNIKTNYILAPSDILTVPERSF